MEKYCKKCDTTKPVDEFGKNKRAPDGIQYYCKICCRITAREYIKRPEVKERRAEYRKQYVESNREKIRDYMKDYREKNYDYLREQEKNRERSPERREKDKKRKKSEHYKAWLREYNQRPEIKDKSKEYRARPEVKERTRKNARERYKKPEVRAKKAERGRAYAKRPEVRARQRQRWKERYASDPEFRANHIRKYNDRRAKIMGVSKKDRQDATAYMIIIKDSPCYYCGKNEGVFHIDHVQPLAREGSNLWYNLVNACDACNLSKNAKTYEEFTGKIDIRHYCVQGVQ